MTFGILVVLSHPVCGVMWHFCWLYKHLIYLIGENSKIGNDHVTMISQFMISTVGWYISMFILALIREAHRVLLCFIHPRIHNLW
jgi:hypothetical protein